MVYLVKAYINEELVGGTWFYDKHEAEEFAMSFEDLNKDCCAFIELLCMYRSGGILK